MLQTYIFSSDGRPAPTSEVVHAMFQRRKIRKLASVCCILIEVSELTFVFVIFGLRKSVHLDWMRSSWRAVI